MPKINFTRQLAEEYLRLYRSCKTDPQKFDEVDSTVESLLANRARYEAVSAESGAPWYFIAAIHNMESGQHFTCHLHNGDPLSERTVHVPAGRPRKGEPPFSWEESALDALEMKRIDRIRSWTLERTLYELEGYNGWGYRLYHPYVLTPYLWSFSNHYTSGKYTADGRWSDTAKSKQCGAAVIIRRLEQRGEISFEEPSKAPLFFYSTGRVEGSEKLQEFLNGLEGIALRVDGWPGKKTSDAVKKAFGFYLHNDPRNSE